MAWSILQLHSGVILYPELCADTNAWLIPAQDSPVARRSANAELDYYPVSAMGLIFSWFRRCRFYSGCRQIEGGLEALFFAVGDCGWALPSNGSILAIPSKWPA
jgi:hypothetical protein